MESFGTGRLSQQLLIGMIMLVPSIMAGMAFLWVFASQRQSQPYWHDVGRLSALNTYGGIIGSILLIF